MRTSERYCISNKIVMKMSILCLKDALVKYYVLLLWFQVDKALQSMEDEAERIYKDERALLLDDEAASTRDAMWV